MHFSSAAPSALSHGLSSCRFGHMNQGLPDYPPTLFATAQLQVSNTMIPHGNFAPNPMQTAQVLFPGACPLHSKVSNVSCHRSTAVIPAQSRFKWKCQKHDRHVHRLSRIPCCMHAMYQRRGNVSERATCPCLNCRVAVREFSRMFQSASWSLGHCHKFALGEKAASGGEWKASDRLRWAEPGSLFSHFRRFG